MGASMYMRKSCKTIMLGHKIANAHILKYNTEKQDPCINV